MQDRARNSGLWLGRFAKFAAVSTFILIIAGGLVTSTESGDAVPDWPKSYGMWFPPMVGGVFYEHGHRMVAGFVGILTTLLAVWLWRSEPRRWVKYLGWGALATVIVQAVLGGLRVLVFFPVPMSISIVHATLAQTYFAWMVSLALFTSREWKANPTTRPATGSPSLRRLCVTTTAVVYVQLILGAVMRHAKAGLAIPDFPLAFGGFIPDLTDGKIAIHFIHRSWALVVAAFILWTVVRVVREHREDLKFLIPAMLLATLVVLQITLGAATVWSRKEVFPTTAHVATGALILVTSWVLTLRAFRFTSTQEAVGWRVPAPNTATESPA